MYHSRESDRPRHFRGGWAKPRLGEPLDPERKEEIIEWVAQNVVKYGLETPAIVALGSSKPALPIITGLGIFHTYWLFGLHPSVNKFGTEAVAVLDDHDCIDRMMKRIDELAEEERKKKRERRKRWEAQFQHEKPLRRFIKKWFYPGLK